MQRRPLFPFDVNGGCATCCIRPDERLFKFPIGGHDRVLMKMIAEHVDWRLGRDGVKRAVWKRSNA